MSAIKNTKLFIGSYAHSEEYGIYKAILQEQTGEITLQYSVKGIENPSFLALDNNNAILYAVSEKSEGKLAAFQIGRQSQTLLPLGECDTMGGSPCHLAVDHVHRLLFIANYSGGNIAVYSLDRNGHPEQLLQNIKHEGTSLLDDRLDKVHPHSVNLDPEHRFLFIPDLGLDEIFVYRILDVQGSVQNPLQFHERVKVKPGAGPRHFAFHPSGNFACVINELDSTIVLYSYDAKAGKLKELQTISTLPYDDHADSYCAHLQFSASGQYLYASNRGHDSIAVFFFDSQDNQLNLVQLQSTGGRYPRHFTISPSGRYLLAANQHSNSIVTFSIDDQGRLHDTGYVLSLPRPVCIVF